MDDLTEQGARLLTDAIKGTSNGLWALISKAYHRRAPAALGYVSWDAYCDSEFESCRIRIPREEREMVVSSLRDSGLSIRAIASATGSSVGTIAATCSKLNASTTTTGIDGRTYGRTKPKRYSLPKAFRDHSEKLETEARYLQRLAADERYAQSLNGSEGMKSALGTVRVVRQLLADLVPDAEDNES
ncbi:hypothetical protein [Rhodococcus jostii]|uniref:hypothetical protein n=1 Tax=Rhodococcus jostii TaxID=132919 RepID=UPI00363E8A1C